MLNADGPERFQVSIIVPGGDSGLDVLYILEAQVPKSTVLALKPAASGPGWDRRGAALYRI